MRVGVIVATRGRPAMISAVLDAVLAQTQQPEAVVVVCTTIDDAGTAGDRSCVSVVISPPGLTLQRNAGLSRLARGTEAVVFFDDDFIPHPGWLAAAAAAFQAHADLAAVTGELIEAERRGTEVPLAEAHRLLAEWHPGGTGGVTPIQSFYGCNMAFRCAAIAGLRFDERLAAYGWLEDLDFGAQVARRGGVIARIDGAVGVHLQARAGRVSGVQFGYAQVVNPLYLARKGTMSLCHALRQIGRDVAANAAGAQRLGTDVDHRGRWRGNLRGLAAILTGRLAPERVSIVARTARRGTRAEEPGAPP